MTTSGQNQISSRQLVEELRQPSTYPGDVSLDVALIETHISWIFLTDSHAYKVKKPVKTDYLDYSTLEQRQRNCLEELRLNRRYAPSLYIDIVPITCSNGSVRVAGEGPAIEYAVRMHRFPDEALLSHQVEFGEVSADEIKQLARNVAKFHDAASVSGAESSHGQPESVRHWACGNFDGLEEIDIRGVEQHLKELRIWTEQFCDQQSRLFHQRVLNGFVRECHGDLHTENIVHWKNRWIPFDGIEFNPELRWIDVLNDASFVSMDLTSRGHPELSHAFINKYLEATGDYSSLLLMRFYQVYRALVRAKIAATRSTMDSASRQQREADAVDCREHLDLASRFSRGAEPTLWITHGFSGSGKSVGSEEIVQRWGAIQLRSDVERKRLFGLETTERARGSVAKELYSDSATVATYGRLKQLTGQILRAGYPVVVDATFLKQDQRALFAECAANEQVPFEILDFCCDEATLRRRISDRMDRGDDASDAGIEVLESQLRTHEPLTATEKSHVVTTRQDTPTHS